VTEDRSGRVTSDLKTDLSIKGPICTARDLPSYHVTDLPGAASPANHRPARRRAQRTIVHKEAHPVIPDLQ